MDNTLVKRWITGIVLLVAILAIIFLSSLEVLFVAIVLIILGGVWEFNNIVFGKGFLKEKVEIIIFALLIPLAFMFGDFQILTALLAMCMIIVFVLFLWNVKEDNFDVMSVAKVIFGIIYIPFLMSHFILLRKLPDGEYWVLLVLVIALVGDTAALYIGKYFGKRKLNALISPAKTVEGTVALVLGSTLASSIYAYLFMKDVTLIHIVIIAFLASIIGQLGDLCESAIKRNYGQKDASSLLPGHGGLLDRMDCLMFIAPFVYYYKIFVIG